MTNPIGHYRERVYAPWWIWLLALSMCFSLGIAFGAALGATIGVITFFVAAIPVSYGLISSAYLISIDDENIRVGRAHLPLKFCGEALALNPESTKQRRGPTADPACYLVLRGWINTAATIDVADPTDATPYWFISSRNPTRLVEALAESKRN